MSDLRVPASLTPGLSAAVRAEAPTPGAPEKDAVRAMFDRIAPRYDLLNRVLSAGTDVRWRRRCVAALELAPGARVLDVCAGTADLLVEALRGGPGRSGVGVDLSDRMLLLGRAKLARAGAGGRSVLAAGDAERLPLADARFDAAMVAFGIRNVGDPLSALREMFRVLRPGGRLAVLEFSMPPGAFGRLYRAYFRHVLPAIGRWLSGDGRAYAYLPASVERWPAPADFGALLAAAGFASVRWTALTGGIAHLHRGDKPA
jgi:demethylmenaquinone methyltransferase/2-methoxy-6-polyprenyl-1,4-benzoquinol methylase